MKNKDTLDLGFLLIYLLSTLIFNKAKVNDTNNGFGKKIG
ncbi:hypothetical protein SAMN05216352_12015 [Alteribacillus bidgolensis]|uniref:Uncharacterized protein n=1 Tax=Alteribacillus bidgolensis TaxID=930129 RepID=A0A1G8QII9_9BACI|nr:hypothetical protein SAMN05216352_12015 [Alteribacillus bidgolensis]